jgi:hypothetical protein
MRNDLETISVKLFLHWFLNLLLKIFLIHISVISVPKILNSFKHERDINVGSIAEESVKIKIVGKVRDALLCGKRKSIVMLQGSQASPISHFYTVEVNVETLDWLEVA